MFSALLQSMRPGHWVKNLIVFAPVIFAKKMFYPAAALRAFLAFSGFCFTASCVYMVNDIADIERDRLHPVKKNRPLCSGRISLTSTALAALSLFGLAVTCGLWLGQGYLLVLVSYFLVNLAYSFLLKRTVILDVMLLASCYVLRVLAGSYALGVAPSDWLLMCTFLLALFLGFGKRRHELVILEAEADHHREVLSQYSPYFLDQMIAVVTASTVMSYALYTISPATVRKFGSHNLIYTTPFVLYGIFRYLYLVHQQEKGGDPARLLFVDRPLLLNILVWLIAIVFLIYSDN